MIGATTTTPNSRGLSRSSRNSFQTRKRRRCIRLRCQGRREKGEGRICPLSFSLFPSPFSLLPSPFSLLPSPLSTSGQPALPRQPQRRQRQHHPRIRRQRRERNDQVSHRRTLEHDATERHEKV